VGLTLLLSLLALASPGRFREANDLARSGDHPKATAIYRELAAGGAESASLYWNWAQSAQARGAGGEALWALLRARELEPGDRAVDREVERLRESLNLDPAEIAPDPLAALRRLERRFHVSLPAAFLLLASAALHGLSRATRARRSLAGLVWACLGLGAVLAAVALSGAWARPSGVVLRRGAPLLDAASPTAGNLGALREGEVVPVLDSSGAYLRVEDSSGARGWAFAEDVGRLDVPPR
jgi:hypothetical protein